MEYIDNYELIIDKFGLKKLVGYTQKIYDARTNELTEAYIKAMWMVNVQYNNKRATLGLVQTSDWQQSLFIPTNI